MSFAATKSDNGSYGVEIDHQIFALDLVTAGVHRQPYLSESIDRQLDDEQHSLLQYHLRPLTNPTVSTLVERKLVELKTRVEDLKHGYRVNTLLNKMDEYRWVSMLDVDCLEINDNTAPFPSKLQLAFRNDHWIRLSKSFAELDDANKAAAILNEILHTTHKNSYSHISGLVGYLFSPQLAQTDARSNKELTSLLNRLGGPNSDPDADGYYGLFAQAYENGDIPSVDDLSRPYLAGRCVAVHRPTTIELGAMFLYELPKDDLLGRQIKIDVEIDDKFSGLGRDAWINLRNALYQEMTLEGRYNRSFENVNLKTMVWTGRYAWYVHWRGLSLGDPIPKDDLSAHRNRFSLRKGTIPVEGREEGQAAMILYMDSDSSSVNKYCAFLL